MKNTSSEQKIGLGFAIAAIGLGTFFGGITCGLFGHKSAFDLALFGTVVTAAASVPLAAGQQQETAERRALVMRYLAERGRN